MSAMENEYVLENENEEEEECEKQEDGTKQDEHLEEAEVMDGNAFYTCLLKQSFASFPHVISTGTCI